MRSTCATRCCAPCSGASRIASNPTASGGRRMRSPVVLDLDGSVGRLPDATVLVLRDWEESIRFGCSLGRMRRLERMLGETLPREHGTVFLGSGDFHHLPWPLV